jgi:oligopeptide transport system ATP-binding protein
MALLDVQGLRTHFHTRDGVVRAVDGVSFNVDPGETLGIVGESGSGKSVTFLSMLGLVPMPPGRIEGGTATFDGTDILRLSSREMRSIRGKEIAMIFQDPMTALNPYMRIGKQLMEPLRVHNGTSTADAHRAAVESLEAVGIQDAERRMRAFPHEFSGGMRQRVMIAMALITKPRLLIADEPTTALDVTVQAQILELIKERQRDLGMAVVLITHDLGVVAGTCDRVEVMYAGRIVESTDANQLFGKPRHPYTSALMASLPSTQSKGAELVSIPGMPPDLIHPYEGCAFAPRCSNAEDRCKADTVALASVSEGHATACSRVLAGEL